MSNAVDTFKALSDEVRLRILHALFQEELSVQELVAVLELPQSTVSRHLKPLREADLVDSRREGTSIYYSCGAGLHRTDLGSLLRERVRELSMADKDASAVKRIVDQRRQKSRDFFDRIAGQYSSLQQPGGGWDALAAGLAVGFTGKEVVDLGSGEGALTLLLARVARRVTAVDLSQGMLTEVKRSANAQGVVERVDVVEADLEAVPLEDESFDAAFLSQSLHHAARPGKAIAEASRLLRRGGSLVVLDLAKHEHEWVREEWADQWLGFEVDDIDTWMKQAGLENVVCETLAGAVKDFSVLLAVGKKQ